MASSGVIYYTDLSGTYFFLHPYSSIGGISFRHKKTGTPFNPNPQTGGKTTLKPGILIFEPGDGGGVFGRNDVFVLTALTFTALTSARLIPIKT